MNADFEQQLSQVCLGDELTLRLEERDDLISACQKISSQAKFRLYIVSRDLEPAVFDNECYCNAVKQLAMRSQKSTIRILIQNSEHMIKNGHCLIELSQRLSSYIDIRIQGPDFREFNEAWLIADNCGLIRRPLADHFKGKCHFNSPREVQERSKQFSLMWDNSVADPNLRRLHL